MEMTRQECRWIRQLAEQRRCGRVPSLPASQRYDERTKFEAAKPRSLHLPARARWFCSPV